MTGGQTHDCTQATALLEAVPVGDGTTQTVTADKAYDTEAILEAIAAMGATAVIPPRVNRRPRRVDLYHYRNRNLIERFFARIKEFRRIATRYDKLASRFGAFIALVGAYVWLL